MFIMIAIHFFLIIKNLKGYFEKYNDNQYLTIIFTSEDQKLMYIEILIKIILKLNFYPIMFYL